MRREKSNITSKMGKSGGWANLEREFRVPFLPSWSYYPQRIPLFWILCFFSVVSLQFLPHMYVTWSDKMANFHVLKFCINGIILYIFLWFFFNHSALFFLSCPVWTNQHCFLKAICVDEEVGIMNYQMLISIAVCHFILWIYCNLSNCLS